MQALSLLFLHRESKAISSPISACLLGQDSVALPFFRAALTARRADPGNVRQARIVCHGHSWTSGGGSGTNDGRAPRGADKYNLINSIPNSWSQKLCESLTAAGIKTIRNGWMGQQRGVIDSYLLNACDPRIKFSEDVVPGSSAVFIGARTMSLPGNGANPWLEFTPGLSFTRFKIWSTRSTNVYSEDTELFVNDVSQTHLKANTGGTWYAFPGAPASGATYAYPGSKIRLVNRSNSKPFSLNGMECFGGDYDNYDVFLTMSGRSAATLADLVSGGTLDSASINAIPVYGCDLLIVEAMVNDMNSAQAQYEANSGNETALTATVNSWKTNMVALFTKNPNCDIIIVGDPDAPKGSASPMIVQRYHTAAQEVIAEQGRGVYVDLRLVWGTYANSTALGYRNTPHDALHPSALGHSKIGDQLARVIANAA